MAHIWESPKSETYIPASCLPVLLVSYPCPSVSMFSGSSSYDEENDRWFDDNPDDMWSDMDDEFLFENEHDDDDDLLTSNTSVNMSEIDRLADRKIVFHRSCMLGTTTIDFDIAALLLESELALNNHEYQASLICARAAEKLAENSLGPATMITMICVYQLGDRNLAVELMNEIQSNPPPNSQISPFLMKKFASTCEVLTFMPQLLSMLQAADKRHPPRKPRRS